MKKIMFNDLFGLTDAVLNVTKTVTRRICDKPPYKEWLKSVNDVKLKK